MREVTREVTREATREVMGSRGREEGHKTY